jgi:hypothetical protein
VRSNKKITKSVLYFERCGKEAFALLELVSATNCRVEKPFKG